MQKIKDNTFYNLLKIILILISLIISLILIKIIYNIATKKNKITQTQENKETGDNDDNKIDTGNNDDNKIETEKEKENNNKIKENLYENPNIQKKFKNLFDAPDKFMEYILTGKGLENNQNKYAEDNVLRNIVKEINYFKENKEEVFFIVENGYNINNLKKLMEKLKSSELHNFKYIFLKNFHWTSGYVVFKNDSFIFHNYNSLGGCIPIQEYINAEFKNIKTQFKSISNERNEQNDYTYSQKDGYFCGYCSLFNINKEFFKSIGIIDDQKQYEIFKKQMYNTSFFLYFFSKLNDFFDHQILFENHHVDYNFEYIKDRALNDQNTNSVYPINSHSKLTELINKPDYKNIIDIFYYIEDILLDQEGQENHINITNNINENIAQIKKAFKDIDSDQILRNKSNKIFNFIKKYNEKIANQQKFNIKDELKEFYKLNLEYKKEKIIKINNFFDEIINSLKNKIYTIKTKQKICFRSIAELREIFKSENPESEYKELSLMDEKKNFEFKISDILLKLKENFNAEYANIIDLKETNSPEIEIDQIIDLNQNQNQNLI
jgi:hypothetical protein